MKTQALGRKLFLWAGSLFGAALYAISLNIIIIPLGLYSGNLTGLCQMISDGISAFIVHRDVNLTGTILYLANIPLLILAYGKLGKLFFLKTIITVTFMSVLLQFLPIPSEPILKDPLTASIIAGILAGLGVGTTLKCGGSCGGTDIIGLYCAMKYPDFSIGKMQNLMSSVVFLYCFIRYDVETVVYSVIFLLISSYAVDQIHTQNIKMSAMIFTRVPQVRECILHELNRGATCWKGEGCYEQKETYVFVTILSKYEVARLKRCIHRVDPQAFIILNDQVGVDGYFVKRL